MPTTTTPLKLTVPVMTDPPNIPNAMTTFAGNVAREIVSVPGGLQEGVIDSGSFMVTQASGGAGMTLDVASNVGSGCYVDDDGPARVSRYYVPPTALKSTVTVATAHATLPRVDAVVVGLDGAVSIVTGTATAGATINNARDGSHGGAAIPNDALHLADIRVGPAATTITNADVRDRRKWARGAHCMITRNANAGGTDNYTAGSTGGIESIDPVNLAPRIECSGAPVEVSLRGQVNFNGVSGGLGFAPLVDGAGVLGMGGIGGNNPGFGRTVPLNAAAELMWHCTFVPPLGSHIISPGLFATAIVTVAANAGCPLQWSVREILAPSATNNTTTSG